MQTNWPDKDLTSDLINFAVGATPTTSTKKKPKVFDDSDDMHPFDALNIESEVDETGSPVEGETTPDAVSGGDGDLSGKKSIGVVTEVELGIGDNDRIYKARVDTGASICSIHGDNIEEDDDTVHFDFGEARYTAKVVRTARVRSADGGTNKRYVIALDMKINDIDYPDVEFTVTNRAHMKYPIILGRNFLAKNNFVVDSAIEE